MSERDPAAGRFAAIQLVRVAGVATVLIGLLVEAERLPGFEIVPSWLGLVLVLVGLVEVFLLPRLLARRWRTPPSLDKVHPERLPDAGSRSARDRE